MLWPERPGAGRNNDSCVVQISDGRHRILLSGDIEQGAERRLLALEEQGEGEELASTFSSIPLSTLSSTVLVSFRGGAVDEHPLEIGLLDQGSEGP